MTQPQPEPEPFTYTDPSDDTLTIGRTSNVVALVAEQGRAEVEIHVLIEDVERVVAAIRTAAGVVQPEPDTALTADEAQDAVSDLSIDLYRAQDALAFVGECCDIANREGRQPTTADVREWLKGARCGRELLALAPIPEEPDITRRERYVQEIHAAGPIEANGTETIADAVMAVADEEQREFRTMVTRLMQKANERHAGEIERLRAELEQARGDTLTEAIALVEDREQRAKTTCGSGLGWEAARDVLRRMLDGEGAAPTAVSWAESVASHGTGPTTTVDIPGATEPAPMELPLDAARLLHTMLGDAIGQGSVPAEGEQALQQRLTTAISDARWWCVTSEHDGSVTEGETTSASVAEAILPVVRDATNAAVRRALAEAADWFETDGRYVTQYFGHHIAAELRRMTTAVASPAREQAPTESDVDTLCQVVAEWITEAEASTTPPDTNRLVWAMEEAGFPLPTEEPTQ